MASSGLLGDVILISGCADEQTSADVGPSLAGAFTLQDESSGAGGAMSKSFASTLKTNPKSWQELVVGMRTTLKQQRFTQIPQFSSCQPLDLEKDPVSIVNARAKSSSKKRALYIGINYFGQTGELRGCINDVKLIQSLVKGKLGFEDAEETILVDDGSTPAPTLKNITAALRNLVKDVESGDSLFLHYSGHGGREKDRSGDEKDGYDETLVPVDYQRSGQLLDDDLFALFVANLPKNVRLTILMDCCHSGSIIDLPLTFLCDDQAAASGHAQLSPNPKFDLKRCLEIGKMLYELKTSGNASNAQIALVAARELVRSEGFMEEAMKLFKACCLVR